MLLCRPFWLPREFTAIIITAVYIPPQANTDQALKELYGNISEQETAYPDAAFIVTGNFNKAKFRTIAPKYFQHITINTRGDRVLDHCYSLFRDAYKSLPRPPFGKSDHSSVLLLPAYRQKLKREAPALRTIQCWSDQSDAILQDCLYHVDWDMFRAASDDDIEAYSDSVTCFIRKCVENKVEEQFNTNNARSMWQGINNITDCKGNKPATVNIAASLPDELNLFLCSFRGSQHRPHRERSRGCCRRGECNLHFCRGCNPILQTGEYPQGCGS